MPVSAIWHSSERDLCQYLDRLVRTMGYIGSVVPFALEPHVALVHVSQLLLMVDM